MIRPDQQVSFNEDIQIGPGVVVSGDHLAETVIGGAPKAGKSTLARIYRNPNLRRPRPPGRGRSRRKYPRMVRRDTTLSRVGPPVDPTANTSTRIWQKFSKYKPSKTTGRRSVILDPLAKWRCSLHELSENVPAHMDARGTRYCGRIRRT